MGVEEQILRAEVPAGARFKGDEDFVLQDLVPRARAIRYRRERWVTPDGDGDGATAAWCDGAFRAGAAPLCAGAIPPGQVTVPRLVAQLRAIGVSIPKRQVMRLLIAGQDAFHTEARDVLRAGLQTAGWITVDDTGARHKAINGFCTQIGNDSFAWFGTTSSKSRLTSSICCAPDTPTT